MTVGGPHEGYQSYQSLIWDIDFHITTVVTYLRTFKYSVSQK